MLQVQVACYRYEDLGTEGPAFLCIQCTRARYTRALTTLHHWLVPSSPRTVVQDREYSVTDRGDYLYITLRDKSRPNSELLVAPIANPQDSKVRGMGWGCGRSGIRCGSTANCSRHRGCTGLHFSATGGLGERGRHAGVLFEAQYTPFSC